MAKTSKTDADRAQAPSRPEARLVKGFRDIEAAELRRLGSMMATIRQVYERYGFEPLETPAFEYTDALGKFLPDQDRPNAGVFSLKEDEDGEWTSLRYDLTAPLARYVAQNYERLPKPYRRYATGSVFRNEKPGPGRYRQFTQFDADTVGTDNIAADAEMCMLAADTLEALGIKRGDYIVKVNNRKLLDGIRDVIGLSGSANDARWLTIMRAIDKLDRLGFDGVAALLGKGRRDESGDFTAGSDLSQENIDHIFKFMQGGADAADKSFFQRLELLFDQKESVVGKAGLKELTDIFDLTMRSGYADRIRIDTSVVRGLEYYTGPVFEAELTFAVNDDQGNPVRFGSVGGGGRYDDLVARFTGEKVPATGFSIGVSRLAAALTLLEKDTAKPALGPVVVLVMDKPEIARYQALTQTLRNAGIRAEMYLGTAGMKPQMKYADKRGAAVVVIQGSREREQGEVVLKDLIEGEKAAAAIKDNAEWKAARPAQVTVKEHDLVAEVRKILALYE